VTGTWGRPSSAESEMLAPEQSRLCRGPVQRPASPTWFFAGGEAGGPLGGLVSRHIALTIALLSFRKGPDLMVQTAGDGAGKQAHPEIRWPPLLHEPNCP